MVSIARKNLFHDRIRFIIAVVGIQFAVVLITVQIGVFLKFLINASVIIDNTDADIWITAKNLQNFDFGRPIPEKKVYQAQKVKGVLWAEKFLLAFGLWKTPDGGQEGVQLVGFNPDTLVGAPWDIVEGNLYDVKYFNSVFIDEAERKRLGNLRIGEETEVNGHKVRLAGITRGARSFIQNAYVFTSFKNAVALSFVSKGNTVYILVKVAPGYTVAETQDRLHAELGDVDVYTRPEFSAQTRRYWMITTGAGIALLSTALMGLVIGTIVVSQTIYASTIEHIKEFGTLKAIGASNSDIYKIIIEQALINSVIGYGLGMLISYFVVRAMSAGSLEVYLPWQVIVAIFFITVVMCIGSSVVSIFKVTRIDPALIFKS